MLDLPFKLPIPPLVSTRCYSVETISLKNGSTNILAGQNSEVAPRLQEDVAQLIPRPMYLPSIYFIHLMVSIYSPGKTSKVEVTTVSSKDKSKSHHDVLHQQHPINDPTPFQRPTPVWF